jgi:hypothetical protein
MIYKLLPAIEGEPQIYARIDDDGKCRLTCTADYAEYLKWLDDGNTPLPADDQTGQNTGNP